MITDANIRDNLDRSFFILSSDYSVAFYTVSREYICNVLRLMNFSERTINMINNVYANDKC